MQYNMDRARSAGITMAVERIYKELGKRIKIARRRVGMNQECLADRVGLVRTSVVNIEAGRQRILFHQIKNIAKALKLEPAILVRGIWK